MLVNPEPGCLQNTLPHFVKTILCVIGLEGKGKFSPVTKHHTMKTYGRMDVYMACIDNLGIRWRWSVSFALRLLYPFTHCIGGLCGHGNEDENLYPCLETTPVVRPKASFTSLTELSRLTPSDAAVVMIFVSLGITSNLACIPVPCYSVYVTNNRVTTF